jgi:cobalamin synthase
MPKLNLTAELTISLVLVLLVGLMTDSFHFWMPEGLYLILTAVFAVVFMLFVTLIWREKARDEREELHRSISSRIAYLAGVITLAIGLLVQSVQHTIDPWLAITLVVMIFAKMGARIYSRHWK